MSSIFVAPYPFHASSDAVGDCVFCFLSFLLLSALGPWLQIPNNLSLPLHAQGVNIVGTHPHMIDSAEDRHKFSQLMDDAGIDQPA